MDSDIHIGTILAITGTNGKTTTTTLLGDIIRRHTPNSYITGNIGFPISDISDKTDEDSIIAVETSSFQLETINEFRPKVSAIINITEDHLNRHKTMERYIECKFNITKNQSYGDYVILNLDDEMIVRYTLEHIFHSDLNIVWFSSTLTRKEIIEKIEYINEVRYEYIMKSKPFENGEKKEKWINDFKDYIFFKNYIYIQKEEICISLECKDSTIEENEKDKDISKEEKEGNYRVLVNIQDIHLLRKTQYRKYYGSKWDGIYYRNKEKYNKKCSKRI